MSEISANVSMASLPVVFVCPEPVLANHCVLYIPARNYCNTNQTGGTFALQHTRLV
jgi:hypothetical protein